MRRAPQRVDAMVQIRHVPRELHRKLKARAATAGTSLSDYLLAELRRIAERPTREEILARIAARPAVRTSQSIADIVREERERR